MKTFNSTAGTTAGQFTLGEGSGYEVRHFSLTATPNGASEYAVVRDGADIDVAGVEFYDIKVLATSGASIVAKHLRGTISGSTITRIEDVFQEDFGADVVLTLANSKLAIECLPNGLDQANYTIYLVLTRVSV